MRSLLVYRNKYLQLDAFMHNWASPPKIKIELCQVRDILHSLYLKNNWMSKLHLARHLVAYVKS